MGRAVGIDLGTTNSVIAAAEGGEPAVITNAEGARTTPSVVAFTDQDERLVGQLARRQAILNPKGTIHSAKRFIGRRYDEVPSEPGPLDVVPGEPASAAESGGAASAAESGGAASARFDVKGKLYAPEEISAVVLRKLAEDASKFLGERVTEAVITGPAYFNDAQRQATKDAGRIAGLDVLRIVNEPTAAALAYGLERHANETVLVFDLGGGTFDVSILDVGEDVVEVRATSGDGHLGGDDFDRRIVDHFADEFRNENGFDLRNDPQALHKAEDAALRQAVDARDDLDALANQVERRLADLGGSVATHDGARAELLVADARQAVSDQAPVARVRALSGDLQMLDHGLGQEAPSTSEDDDVIDAEFTAS